MSVEESTVALPAGERIVLPSTVRRPEDSRGLVVVAHGSESSRFGPRNPTVAKALAGFGCSTLLCDLLTEEEPRNHRNVFELNNQARSKLPCQSELSIIEAASHLFEEPCAPEELLRLAAEWFGTHLTADLDED